MRFLVLALIIFNSYGAWAYSKENLIHFYESFYTEELGIGFLVKRYNIRDPKLRREILSYMRTKNLEVSTQEIEKEWLAFIKTNYKNPLELQEIIENSYHNIEQAKAKFIDDLDLKKYFKLVVVARLEEDFKLRDKLLSSVITVKMNAKEKLEAKKQFLTVMKLDQAEDLEAKYSLTQEDLDYLLTSNFLLEKKSFSVYNLDLQKRIYNLKANSKLNTKEAKKFIFSNYKNRAEYLY